MISRRGVSILLCLVALVGLASSARAGEPADFNRDVRPILSAKCFKCHGVDENSRKAKLRLDRRESAVAALPDGKWAVEPGKPEESELVRRVFSDDPEQVMPPASTKVVLTPSQKDVLRRWVAEGAEYKPHWAFVAPKQAPLPVVKQTEWVRNPIDRFVLTRLEAQGLRPSAEADRYTLVRRLYLDLIGLPPAPDEADAFVNDASRDAYEKLVDRLLASPHYGERWARRWLDLARYADTNGYEKDRPRSIWPYRDWVIAALNADMPFDEFTVEQLAGDLLPNATPQQRIATGFHRNTMLNEEGGIDPLEFRFYATVDRVATTGTTWLGLTVGCAQCHSHKFDPITHAEYYRFMAFLDNADEPEMEVPDPAAQAKRKEIEAKVAKLKAELPDKWPGADDTARKESLERAFGEWQQRESAKAVKWAVLRPAEMRSSKPILTILDDDSVLAGGDITKSETYDLTFRTDRKGITAVRLEALPHESLPRHGPGLIYYEGPAGDFCLSEITLNSGGAETKFAKAAHSFAAGQFTAAKAIDGNPQTGWMIDGGQGKPHAAVFGLAKPLDAAAGEFTLHMLFERHFAPALGHFRISITTDPRAAEPTAVLPPEVEAALATSADDRTDAQRDRLRQYFLSVAPELADARKAIAALEASLPKPTTTLVMSERAPGHDRPTFVHKRGEFLQPKEQVSPGVPAFLPPPPAVEPANRLTFAGWLVSRENPLTARVTVNRQWAAFFGRGIVRTLNDFGYQGELPSHPELLDWLAVEFMNDGWSMKKLDRLIVTSATYRQTSRVTPDLLARDPENVLLARGPRFRVEAEVVRDSALRAAGLLSEKLGGPSVFPPQPASVTTEGTYGALAWKASTGEDRFRRSLYTYAKRTAPFAMYNTFDAPSGEACVARREVSNTPLQALTLLNDTVFVEAAQALGKAIAAMDHCDDAGRATALFRRCLTRPPEPEEVKMLTEFVARQRERFARKEMDAAKVAGPGDGDPAERAAWTVAARAVLNFDEAVTRN